MVAGERCGSATPRWGSAPTPHSVIPPPKAQALGLEREVFVLNHPFGNTPHGRISPHTPNPHFSQENYRALGMWGNRKTFSLVAHVAA